MMELVRAIGMFSVWMFGFAIFLMVVGPIRIKGKSIWCRVNLHKWEIPGDPCSDCGKPDNLFFG